MSDARETGLVDRVLAHCCEPLVVAGDLLLDRFVSGPSDRLSREAPAPVVSVRTRQDVPGGAANTAVNLAALGATVRVVGAIGDDEAGDSLVRLLQEAGVDTAGVVRLPGLATTLKTRVVAAGQVLVRFDEGAVLDGGQQEAVAAALHTALDGAEGVLVCDYGMGATEGAVRERLRDDRPAILVVDAHDLEPWAPLHPTAVTPNAGEAQRLLGRTFGADRVAEVAGLRDELLGRTGAEGVIVTLDRDGTVVHGPGAPSRTFARPAPESMANGAGDTFAAALLRALAAGCDLHDAAVFAQLAADVVVRQTGTSVCTADALIASLSDGARLLDERALVAALQADRKAGRRIVFTNGCFDVLHLGHISYLKQAKQLGDVLVVAVNDDDSVRRLKGPGRPINTAADRAGVLAELSSVDYVTVFGQDTPIHLIETVEPDVYTKGGDYTPEMLVETPIVRAHGGEVRIVDWVSSHSTSGMLARARVAGVEAQA
ncbi:D-glycero-beta-D-manno-heptose 1-phosphate adenylyltransferase [Amnibacterium endophyticum]|uniref:D-glycero-beta-D-manno-heptose 1-phosphate adenylyltransferase n=1 Tax=Amnibacterium endophyticum TaxID=2109337 RepID=A0ABW4L9Y9_9MICO